MSKKIIKISKFTVFSLILFASSVTVLSISLKNKVFASFFNEKISSTIRTILSSVSNLVPFSIAELLVFLLPIIITLVTIATIKNKHVSVFDHLSRLASFFLIFISLYIFSFGTGYYTKDYYDRFDLNKTNINLSDLKETAEILVLYLNNASDVISYDKYNFSIMPYDLATLDKKINTEYNKLYKKYNFLDTKTSKTKPVLLSKTLSKAQITGLYSFFTGEINLNTDFPDYTIPFTVAHEFAHQRGIAREDDANITAFLVCINSDDEYLRYSALINAFEYVASALYEADSKTFNDIYYKLDIQIRKELFAYAEFYKKYEDSISGTISTKFGNAYLMLNGEKEGVQTYGLVVNLLVSYFMGEFK